MRLWFTLLLLLPVLACEPVSDPVIPQTVPTDTFPTNQNNPIQNQPTISDENTNDVETRPEFPRPGESMPFLTADEYQVFSNLLSQKIAAVVQQRNADAQSILNGPSGQSQGYI